VTVEDPVEFQMKGFNQVNIRAEFGLSFPAALRSILRQDPDVILIGEIRDRKPWISRSKRLDRAPGGLLPAHHDGRWFHHTHGYMGIEPFLITSSVVAIVAQRLVRRVCQKCRELYKVSEEMTKEFRPQRIAAGP